LKHVIALLWEQTRRSWLLYAGLLAAGCVSIFVGDLAGFAVAVPLLFLFAHFATADRSRIPGVSDYALSLPIASRALAFSHLVFGIGCVLSLTLILTAVTGLTANYARRDVRNPPRTFPKHEVMVEVYSPRQSKAAPPTDMDSAGTAAALAKPKEKQIAPPLKLRSGRGSNSGTYESKYRSGLENTAQQIFRLLAHCIPAYALVAASVYLLFWSVGVLAPRAVLFIGASLAALFLGTLEQFEVVTAAFWFANFAIAGFLAVVAAIAMSRNRYEHGLPGARQISVLGEYIQTRRTKNSIVVKSSAPNALHWLWRKRTDTVVCAVAEMEWKRTYRWIPLITWPALAAMAMFCLGDGIDRRSLRYLDEGFFFMAYMAVPITACLIVSLVRDATAFQSARSGNTIHEFTLPISQRQLSNGKLFASLKAIVITYLGCMVIALALRFAYPLDEDQVWDIVISLLLGSTLLTALAWSLTWSGIPFLLFAAIIGPRFGTNDAFAIWGGLAVVLLLIAAISRNARWLPVVAALAALGLVGLADPDFPSLKLFRLPIVAHSLLVALCAVIVVLSLVDFARNRLRRDPVMLISLAVFYLAGCHALLESMQYNGPFAYQIAGQIPSPMDFWPLAATIFIPVAVVPMVLQRVRYR
jgi:hypothetical protein